MKSIRKNSPAANRRIPSSFVLCFMITAGLARIAVVTLDDYQLPAGSNSPSADAVAVRRSLQLVACSMQALLARYGLALATDACDSESQPGSALGTD